jgi:alcohol dehydrogenase (cytochrome c)
MAACSARRHNGLTQIDTRNVNNLAPAWVFQTGDYENGLQATPTSNTWAFALDGATGRPSWEYHYALPADVRLAYGKQDRGVLVSNGLVFMGPPDNHRVAINRKTGVEVWRVSIEDFRQCGCNTTGAPLTDGSTWQHSEALRGYSDAELGEIAKYFEWVAAKRRDIG